MDVFDIDYMGMQLQSLEAFDEGKFVFASRLQFERKFVPCHQDPTMWTHHTLV